MVHVRTQLEQLAPGQKCPGAQLMQFRWHTMSFIWQMAKWQKAKARPEAFASLACGLGLGVRKLHFAGEKLALPDCFHASRVAPRRALQDGRSFPVENLRHVRLVSEKSDTNAKKSKAPARVRQIPARGVDITVF